MRRERSVYMRREHPYQREKAFSSHGVVVDPRCSHRIASHIESLIFFFVLGTKAFQIVNGLTEGSYRKGFSWHLVNVFVYISH